MCLLGVIEQFLMMNHHRWVWIGTENRIRCFYLGSRCVNCLSSVYVATGEASTCFLVKSSIFKS